MAVNKGKKGKPPTKAVAKSAALAKAKPKIVNKPVAVTATSKKPPLVAVSTDSPKQPVKTVNGGKRKPRVCTEPGCNTVQVNDQYCRLHYIKNWVSIISGRRAQARANLNKYIESVSEKYPDEYMEKIRDDLGGEGNFHARLRELGFREEYESTSGGDNPFQMETFDEFVHGLKFED